MFLKHLTCKKKKIRKIYTSEETIINVKSQVKLFSKRIKWSFFLNNFIITFWGVLGKFIIKKCNHEHCLPAWKEKSDPWKTPTQQVFNFILSRVTKHSKIMSISSKMEILHYVPHLFFAKKILLKCALSEIMSNFFKMKIFHRILQFLSHFPFFLENISSSFFHYFENENFFKFLP